MSFEKKLKAKIVKKLQRWLAVDEQSAKCLLFSAVLHVGFLIMLLLLMLPAHGRPDPNLIAVSLGSVEQSQADEQQPQEQLPIAETVEDPDTEIDSQQIAEQLAQEILTDKTAVEEYRKQHARRRAEKQERLQKLRSGQQNIDKAATQRQKFYGTLQPRTFYGVRVFARNMVFILDISGSMNIEEARMQLKNAYHALNSEETFNLIAYADQVHVWQQGLVAATDDNKKKADLWVNDLQPGGATNIYEAMQKAFAVAWQTTKTETMYLVSDGLPTKGPVQDPVMILKAIRNWNQEKRIIIHTIGIGFHQDRQFLQTMAKQNDGRYYVR